MTLDVQFAPGPRLLTALTPGFPRGFADLPAAALKPPGAIWVDGRLPLADETLVAIVGSRSASLKACAQITALAAELASGGYPIISGGALGIDAAAHRGALQADPASGAATFAVLGCGIDVVYPDRHAALFRDIAGRGGLLSEYPPGEQPRRGQFPARNRLVAALARVVVVGECRARSGALITARIAAKMGRRLCALPGSSGTDGLLASGAAWPVRDAADVLRALAGIAPAPASDFPGVSEGEDSTGLRRLLNEGPLTAEEVSVRLGRGLGEVLGLLSEGELEGWVLRRSGGRFEVHRGH
jgi:DNA processing protein